MSESAKWPEPVAHAVKAFDQIKYLTVRSDWAEENASRYREQAFINVSTVPLFSYAQVREIVAAEMEECAKLCLSEHINSEEKSYGQALAAIIRSKIKEMRGTDDNHR